MKKTLILNLKTEYFNDIKKGEKLFEYRLIKPFWEKRLEKNFDFIEIRLGYPKSTEKDKIMKFEWNGFKIIDLLHKEFGSEPVKVFAISLEKRIID